MDCRFPPWHLAPCITLGTPGIVSKAFEVEFCDPNGATYALHTLRPSQFLPLHTRGQPLRLRAGAA